MYLKLAVGEICDINLQTGLSIYKDKSKVNFFIKTPNDTNAILDDRMINIGIGEYQNYTFIGLEIEGILNKSDIGFNIRSTKEYVFKELYQGIDYEFIFILMNNDNLVKSIRKIKINDELSKELNEIIAKQLEISEKEYQISRYESYSKYSSEELFDKFIKIKYRTDR